MTAEQFNTKFSITDKKTHMQRVAYVSKQIEGLHTCYTYIDKPSYKLVSIYESNDSWVFWLKDKEIVVLPKCVGINSFITAMGVMKQNVVFVETFKDTYTKFGNCSIESHDCESGLVFLKDMFSTKHMFDTTKSLEKELDTLKALYYVLDDKKKRLLTETKNCWIFECSEGKSIIYKNVYNDLRIEKITKGDISEFYQEHKERSIKGLYDKSNAWQNVEYHDAMSSEKFLNTEFPESRI